MPATFRPPLSFAAWKASLLPRRYRLELDAQPPGGFALVQIGSDGGLLARPVGHDALEIAPADLGESLLAIGVASSSNVPVRLRTSSTV